MPTQRDYYSILQVNPSATQEQLDAAYERLSRLYDPDVSRKPKAAQRKAELDEAYEVLSDRKRRAEYDRMRAKGWRPGQPRKEERPASGVFALLGNPYVFAGLLAGGVVAIVVIIVLVSLVTGDGTEESVANLSPTPSAPATPTIPAQVPTTAPAAPPEVTGSENTTPSGLKYIDIEVGTGERPQQGDTAVVNYTGWLQETGAKFDSSLERAEPFTFVLGAGQVIPGWDDGVATMNVGGLRRLIVPGDLAYGEAGRPPTIPPNATLIFDIELLDVFPAASPTPAPTPAVSPATEGSPAPRQ